MPYPSVEQSYPTVESVILVNPPARSVANKTPKRGAKPAAAARPPRQRAPQAGNNTGVDLKRERILRAAERLFHAQGYERTTLDQVAAALGVSKPFVYYYFHNKQELFERLSWAPTVACFTVLDGDEDAHLPAHQRVAQGLERLIAHTIAGYPAAFFAYREPQAYRPEYLAAQRELARHFYTQLCALLEQARSEGTLAFDDTMLTALAACSLPGFLYTWYQPDGRLDAPTVVRTLSQLAWRVIGLNSPSQGDTP
jgi:AcrR family transcriptional regulator